MINGIIFMLISVFMFINLYTRTKQSKHVTDEHKRQQLKLLHIVMFISNFLILVVGVGFIMADLFE